MADGEVDRQKATVEDNPSSIVDRGKATIEDSPPTVDRNKETIFEASDCVGGKYTLIFYIQEDPPPNLLLKHIPKDSQYCPWNQAIIFGRGEDANIFLNDERVSRGHLELTGLRLPTSEFCLQVIFNIRNVSNTNPVLVNGQEIKRKEIYLMKSGEIITIGKAISFKLEINPGEDMENYILKFVHPQNNVCGIEPVQEIKSQGGNVGRNQVIKQASENKDDENDAKPTQDTQQPKYVD